MDKSIIKAKIKERSVLFVDDELVVTEIMKNILPHLFKEVHFANNGVDGIKIYSNSPTDLIITDISMPKINGIEMVNSIKMVNDDVKCIFLSGHNEQEYIEKCQGKNIQYLIKPINSSMLFEALEKLF